MPDSLSCNCLRLCVIDFRSCRKAIRVVRQLLNEQTARPYRFLPADRVTFKFDEASGPVAASAMLSDSPLL